MGKQQLVPRTELLQWLNQNPPAKFTDLYRIWGDLKAGRVIDLHDWSHASYAYHGRYNPDTEGCCVPEGAQVPSVSTTPGSVSAEGSVWPMGNGVQRQNQPLESAPTEVPEVREEPSTDDQGNAVRSPVGSILGAYRLATPSGFVIFASVQGDRGPVTYCGVGLGFPQELSDFDIKRVIEFGKVVNLDNIKEILHV